MAAIEEKVRDDDENYDEDADEDFSPEAADQDENLSSSEDETTAPAARPGTNGKKRKLAQQDDGDAQLDSGDEATIKERRKRRRKEDASDSEGGSGGFVKTRSQRKNAQLERGPLATTKGATVDVDALWARLSSLPLGTALEAPRRANLPPEPHLPQEEYITIKRTTKFAGEVTTEQRQVLKSSKEAKIYLAELETERRKKEQVEASKEKAPESMPESPPESPSATAAQGTLLVRRPLKRPSRFDPNPHGEVRNLPPHLQLRWPRNKVVEPPQTLAANQITGRMLPPKLPAAAKLNVVQKSRHDWAGFVDQAGLAEELDVHGRSKKSYLERTDFLNRVADKREAERKDAKRKGL